MKYKFVNYDGCIWRQPWNIWNFRHELFYQHSPECYFGVYFPRCCATREINNHITFLWAHKQTATQVHTLFYVNKVQTMPVNNTHVHKQNSWYLLWISSIILALSSGHCFILNGWPAVHKDISQSYQEIWMINQDRCVCVYELVNDVYLYWHFAAVEGEGWRVFTVHKLCRLPWSRGPLLWVVCAGK